MSTPRIGYDSMLRKAVTITDPGSATGYPITNLYDMRATTVWRSDTLVSPINIDIDSGAGIESANYIGLVHTNLESQNVDVKVLTGPTFPPANVRLAATVPDSDEVAYLQFTGLSSRYWRIILGEDLGGAPFAVAPEIGELYLGERINFPEYMAPSFDPFFSSREAVGSRGSGGHYIAGSTRRIHRGRITFGQAGDARSPWDDFYEDHALLRYPFFFVVDLGDADFDVPYFVKFRDDADAVRVGVAGLWSRFVYDLDVEAAYSEAA